ncbi:MAG: YceI family protein [Flavobacteriales bacterium TMED191]|nr:MAG: YceI family protein [Flavobacteriales bacterium TMED191]
MQNKFIYFSILLTILSFMPSFACENCGCRADSNKKTSHIHNKNITTSDIYAQKSTIVWKASKVGGTHEGNIAIRSGHLHFEENKLVSGKVNIDMNSIFCTDLEGTYKEQLEKHLKSADFFDTNKHHIASIDILECKHKGYGKYDIISEITIKGITNTEEFTASVKDGKASAEITLDRAKYDVRYGSGSFFSNLGNNLIYDEFELKINLTY